MLHARNGECTRMAVPHILIPRFKDVISDVGIGLRGELVWQLIETKRFARPTVVQSGRQRNLIVNAGFDAWIGSWSTSAASRTPLGCARYMAVGTGVTAPDATQTALTTEIARKENTTYSRNDTPPPSLVISFTFSENEANGDLTEWGTFASSSGGPMWCRELFRDEIGNPVVVTKTNTQVLLMQYTLYLQRAIASTSTQFVIDGTTYTCVATINDNQLIHIRDAVGYTAGYPYNYGIGYRLDSVSLPGKILVGTSNSASDLATDAANKLYGSVLLGSVSTVSQMPTISTYTTASAQRSITYYLGPTEANGNIGEAVVGLGQYSTTEPPYYGARVTFTPAIAKDSSKKVVLTVTFSFANL